MARINSFSDDSAKRIAESVRRLEAQVRDLRGQVRQLRAEPKAAMMPVQIRTGITHQGPSGASYPTEGCKFWVRLQDWGWTEETGDCDQTQTDHESVYVLGKVYREQYIPEGELVLVIRIAGKQGMRHLIVPLAFEIMLGKLDGDLNQGSTATMSEWQRNSADSGWEDTGDNYTIHDWLLPAGEKVSSGKKVIAGRVRLGGTLVLVTAECE